MTLPTDERSPIVAQRVGAAGEPAEPPVPATRAGRLRWLAGSGWPPVALLVLATTAVLWFYGVDVGTSAAFTGYIVGCVALPGTLVWRAVMNPGRWFGADVAAGTAVGYAGEVALYIVGRWVDVPLLVLAWPVGVVGTFLAVPRLRRYLRGAHDAPRPPALWSWCLAAIVAATVLWSVKFFRWYGLTWPGYANVDTDSPFHLALIGEAKHHMPMQIPWLAGEPLYYHWFVYAEMAATSWVTGIEPQVLLLRLAVLPMLGAFVVLVAALAVRLLGAWWTGIAAPAVTLFVLAPDPYAWPLPTFHITNAFGPVDDGSVLRLTVWTGPTQTFGALLFVPVVLVLVELLRRQATGVAAWLLFGLMVAAVAGAKATYLPLLVAALLLVIAGRAVADRKLHRPAAGAAGIALGIGLCAQVVLFGGTAQGGLHIGALKNLNLAGITGTGVLAGPGLWRPLLVLAVTAWCWACVWAGISGLVRRRQVLEPAVLLLIGLGVAGAGATLLLVQQGDSQRFFFEAARPYLSVAAVAGLAAVLRPAASPRVRVLMLLGAVCAGAVVARVTRSLDRTTMPATWNTPGPTHLVAELVWPYLALAGCAAVAIVALAFFRRSVPLLRGTSHALVIALLAGFGVAATVQNYTRLVADGARQGWRGDTLRQRPADPMVPGPLVTEGTREAGRWLRGHSDPDDLIATNAHCLPARYTQCVNLHFAVAAYTERRVLVEGWGFTHRSHQLAKEQGTWMGFVPYWDREKLAANDAVFQTPTVAGAGLLRSRYRVRWLFVDETGPVPNMPGDVAAFRFRSGRTAVYELVEPASDR